LLLLPAAGWGQTVTTTIPVGKNPVAIAVNPATNKIYVANCPDLTSRTVGINGTITVIDGETNISETVEAGLCPAAVAVNPATNKIYVANVGHTSLYCGSCFDYGNITVIDGVTNVTTTVKDPNAKFPVAVAVNPVTNKIYVANNWNGSSGNVTVIDGATNSTTSVSVGPWPNDLAVNTATNKIYVTSFNPYVLETSTAVSLIDGATNSYVALTDPNADDPIAVAVNPITNKIYVANNGNVGKNGTNIGSITVIDGATNSITNLVDANANSPHAVAINPVSNKVYIANANSVVTELDGATNSITTITDPSATNSCNSFGTSNVVIDSTRNLAYVANCGSNNVTVIDGTTNSVVTVTDSSAVRPIAVAVNSVTNKIYVANAGSNNVTVIDGGVGTRPEFILSVTEAGSGRVTSNPAGIDCGSTCAATFAAGTPVTLIASPGSDFTFSGWSGACSGTSTCSMTMASNELVTATFNSSPPPDFSLTPASASLTMKPLGQTTDVITIAPQNGSFSDAVQLSCAVIGSTPMATCVLSSSSVILGVNSATSTLTITAPAQSKSAGLMSPVDGQLAGLSYAVLLPLPGLTLIGLGLVSSKSKNWRRQLRLLSSLLIAFVVVQVGCGGGSSTPPPPPPPLSYTISVMATAGAIQHSTQVRVTVQ
jgi:DNA-binding beta-propeller fold protein YncE